MSYGHAQRNLDTIRILRRDTERLLRRHGAFTAEQRRLLYGINPAADELREGTLSPTSPG